MSEYNERGNPMQAKRCKAQAEAGFFRKQGIPLGVADVSLENKRSAVSNNKRDECNSNNAKSNIKTTTEREKCIA